MVLLGCTSGRAGSCAWWTGPSWLRSLLAYVTPELGRSPACAISQERYFAQVNSSMTGGILGAHLPAQPEAQCCLWCTGAAVLSTCICYDFVRLCARHFMGDQVLKVASGRGSCSPFLGLSVGMHASTAGAS